MPRSGLYISRGIVRITRNAKVAKKNDEYVRTKDNTFFDEKATHQG
jgi:hypothetical protein